MKKVLILTLVAILLVSFSMVGCDYTGNGGTGKACRHEGGTPDCGGRQVCTNCGELYAGNATSTPAHDFINNYMMGGVCKVCSYQCKECLTKTSGKCSACGRECTEILPDIVSSDSQLRLTNKGTIYVTAIGQKHQYTLESLFTGHTNESVGVGKIDVEIRGNSTLTASEVTGNDILFVAIADSAKVLAQKGTNISEEISRAKAFAKVKGLEIVVLIPEYSEEMLPAINALCPVAKVTMVIKEAKQLCALETICQPNTIVEYRLHVWNLGPSIKNILGV